MSINFNFSFNVSALIILALSSFTATAAIEYNVWYKAKGITSDVTQTKDGDPVLVSFAYQGTPGSNLVVSYTESGDCDKPVHPFYMNSKNVYAETRCYSMGKNKRALHYLIKDLEALQYFHSQLNTGFTVILQNNIRVWVANYKEPKPGHPQLW